MAKKTWVKVGSTWREVKDVWLRTNGTWKRKVVPKIKISNNWKDAISYGEYLFPNDVNRVEFVNYFNVGSNFSSYASYMRSSIREYYSGGGFGTNEKIDLSEYSRIYIDWEGSGDEGAIYSLGIFYNKSSYHHMAHSRNSITSNRLTRRVTYLDIKDIDGDWFVGVHVSRVNSGYRTTSLTVHGIWLEE